MNLAYDFVAATGMRTYVYDFPAGGVADFYIEGDYVYLLSGGNPSIGSAAIIGMSTAPSGDAAFSVSGKYVYEHPTTGTPKYYVSDVSLEKSRR